MPINFDELAAQEDRDFIIRGEQFTLQHVRPEVMDEIDGLEEEYLKIEDPKYSDIVKLAESRLRLMLDDGNGQVERWEELRARKDNPVTYGEIMALSRRALEIVSGVPTMPSEASTAGDGKTAESSTVVSR